MDPLAIVRFAAPAVLAVLAAFGIDRLTARRGLDPPGFQTPWRRVAALFLLTIPLWVALFGPLAAVGTDDGGGLDFAHVGYAELFALQVLFALVAAGWYVLGFAGFGSHDSRFSVGAQLGFRTPRPLFELGLGLLAGVALWAFVLCSMMVVAGIVFLFGGEDALPKAPPPAVSFVAGLPLLIRALLSLSAGVVEETFFRGLLQPRVGILLATVGFVLAHVAYGQALMLVGITLLSVSFGLLVRWRQNLWPAIAAHALFDAVQLLVVVPAALQFLDSAGARPVGALATIAAAVARWVAFC
jgi:membrane protease YdiL (CAAX protease family)